MQARPTTSIVLYGDFDSTDASSWRGFYQYATELIASVGLSLNYLGIKGQSFKSRKILRVSRTHRRLMKSLDDAEEILALELYSLPEDFKTAAFDYDVYICRTMRGKSPHLIATFANDWWESVDQDEVVSRLKEFVEFESGQIFEMQAVESPQIYAAKANSPDVFRTIRVVRELT